MKLTSLWPLVALSLTSHFAAAQRTEKDGWICVKLHGTPHQIGVQHGTLLAAEIDDMIKTEKAYVFTNTKQPWSFYRNAARRMFWKRLDKEYRDEIAGIAEGLMRKGYRYDATDILAHNGFIELSMYYEPYWEAKQKKVALVSKAPDSCSAFIATGKQTKDGKIVMAHNCWIDYVIGQRWRAVLDIRPTHGNRILMDALPGFIHSGDDFAINSAGLMVTETTISGAAGFDEKGIPEFERMRKAMQYSNSLDDFYRLMVKGNNGGYANTWLVGDSKTNEIGELELALKNVVFKRTTQGAYVSANFPQDSKLIAEDCTINMNNGSNMCSDRHARWNELMKKYEGKIDAHNARLFLGDHHDAVRNVDGPSSSTLCGHFDLESRKGFLAVYPDNMPLGSVQGKVTTSGLVKKMSFWARMGHPCGIPFLAKPFLAVHPEFGWQKKYLRDMPTKPWVLLSGK